MMKRIFFGAAVLVLLSATGALAAAAPDVAVEEVQMPAWIERGGTNIPLVPGMELKDHDQVKTGPGARVLLSTADGSSVKLGERGSLALENLRMRPDGVFEAALKVAEGAFRFTTDVLARFRGRREISISIAAVTAGIRGTDLWGKSAPDKQIVCLIEGKVEVTPPGESPIDLDQRMSFYVRDKGQSQPVATVMPDQLTQWATETETQPGRGVTKRGGKWKVIAASDRSLDKALDASKQLRDAGYAAEIIPAKVKDKRVYNVVLPNFASRKDAEFVADALKAQGRVERARVGM